MNRDPKELMEEGWKLREILEFNKAEESLVQAKNGFENQEDWFNVTECLNHLSYNEKLKSKHAGFSAIRFAEESYQIAKKNNTKMVFCLRALLSASMGLGNYERSKIFAEELVSMTEKSASKGDFMRHLAECQLRTGDLISAEKTIEKSLELIDKGWEEEMDPQKSIWKTAALILKAIILYNKGNLEESKRTLQDAKDIAEKMNLKTRLAEISEAMKLFN